MYPEQMRYTKEHEWIEVQEDGSARVGITDYAQHELGDIVFVELPSLGDEFEQGEAFGVVESVKAVSDLYTPVSGKVKAVNGELENQPELINQSPHDEGWIITIEVSDDEELSGLMTAEEYTQFLDDVASKSEKKKKKKKRTGDAAGRSATRTSSDDHEADDDADDEEVLDGYTEESADGPSEYGGGGGERHRGDRDEE
jgi:glycine cleavage system H protein